MNCQLCLDTTLDITFHGGIELDICPRCRGVWLDRGELERLADDRPTGHDRPHENPDGRPGESKPRKKRKQRLADRLGDVFEEIIDL